MPYEAVLRADVVIVSYQCLEGAYYNPEKFPILQPYLYTEGYGRKGAYDHVVVRKATQNLFMVTKHDGLSYPFGFTFLNDHLEVFFNISFIDASRKCSVGRVIP